MCVSFCYVCVVLFLLLTVAPKSYILLIFPNTTYQQPIHRVCSHIHTLCCTFANTLLLSSVLLHRCLSRFSVFLLDLIQFQHPSARHLYSCFFLLFFLIVLQLRVCFFFFCVNTTRVFSHVFVCLKILNFR